MTEDISYTTEELAKLLKISKLTVYDLIKKGELTAYRVGKQMRVDAVDLEAYKSNSKGMRTGFSPDTSGIQASSSELPAARKAGDIVITGQDISLDMLADRMEQSVPGIRPLRSYVGSLDSLIAMYRGEADIVSTHLLDGDTGHYNLPYIRRLLVGFSYVVVHLLVRNAGLYVRAGNPLKIRSWEDLKRPGVRIVNRERGSGARVLLDEQLRLMGIPGAAIAGYHTEVTNHLAVAGRVASGGADAGIGIEQASRLIGKVDFVPLIRERYDLVMIRKPGAEAWIAAVLAILKDPEFQAELAAIGYDLSETGTILYET
jgi:putative molybdopterin biosynthesis protein